MSHYRLKTTWEEVTPPYGQVVKHTLYAHHNLSCDTVTFYDDKGEYLLEVNDTDPNNLLDAINRLYRPWQRSQVLDEKVDYMTPDEFGKVGG